jgi:hypothetical protein
MSITAIARRLVAHGLYVSESNPGKLWVAANLELKTDAKLAFSKTACTLEFDGQNWSAYFPVRPPLECVLRGTMGDLEDKVLRIMQTCQEEKVSLWAAFEKVVGDPNRYIEI